jgi:WD40 repeat protein
LYNTHEAPVTSVRFNGVADRVLSASQDQTIRSWSIKDGKSHLDPRGILASTKKAVRVIRYRPVNNNLVAAGLENGEIQLWDVVSKKQKKTLDFLSQKDDRVFDLLFTKDSRYLFSAHGSGSVLLWDMGRVLSDDALNGNKPLRGKKLNFAVYALGLVGNTDANLAMAGRYNLLGIWNLPSDKIRRLPYRQGGPDDYIDSIATADEKPNLMATADNQGYITLWDMNQCLDKGGQCKILEEWRDGHGGKPVRSVALSNNGCYLASAGDDGRVMLWPLAADGKRVFEAAGERKVAQFSNHVNSVDLALTGDDILITSGGDDHQVRLLRVKQNNTACQ